MDQARLAQAADGFVLNNQTPQTKETRNRELIDERASVYKGCKGGGISPVIGLPSDFGREAVSHKEQPNIPQAAGVTSSIAMPEIVP